MSFPAYADLLITLGDLVYFIAFVSTLVAIIVVSRASGSPFRFMHLLLAWVVATGLSSGAFYTVGRIVYGAAEGAAR